MDELLDFLARFEIWIYAVLLLIGLWHLRKLLSAWREWRGSVYGLEREKAQTRFSAALSMLVLTTLLGVGEFFLVTFVSPNLPSIAPLATPTLELLTTPTATLPLLTVTVEATDLPGSTLAPVIESDCVPDEIEWTFPSDGEQITGLIEPRGTVNVPNLGFYKYEYSPADSGNWTAIAAGNQVRIDQPLGGSWNTSTLIPGDYRLRLVVTDNQNGIFPACVITVQITSE